ncbi:nickel ABC transporter permease [Paenibacillus sedimenti]|uniref:Nickel import system permease protein NikB n=1 Tax=Paenibacillus sedimenti TaxID=2770274 RepID=A0A926KXT6_9BACL|nr:nickel ABC transporter permease [Paenibacillus sedimenti]MBD0384233.1 ABC transporter permease subunit [Paenibacillus sedimenti]
MISVHTLGFIMKRLAGLPLILLGVSVLTFLLLRLVPVEPAEVILHLSNTPPTDEAIAQMRTELGMDRSLILQFGYWLSEMCRFNFGVSYVSKLPVAHEIAEKFPVTLQLTAGALLLTLLLSVPLGILSALYPNKPIDQLSRLLAFVGASVPRFWLSFILLYLFSMKLDWFPVQGTGTLLHLILPSFTLAFTQMAVFTRLLRSGILDQLKEPYVLYARARGLRESIIIVRHILKIAMLPVVTALAISMGHLLAGTVMVEQIFGWPGLGRYLIESIINRDYPVIQCYALLMALIFVFANLIVDILQRMLDPRTMMKGGS